MKIPRIGISTYTETAQWGVWTQPAALIPETYLNIVKSTGAAPVLLPPSLGLEQVILDGVDALVVAGGPDVAPERYGAQRHPRTGPEREDRDSWELALLDEAQRRRMPTLAICRGMQLLNVQRGGTLHQHVPDVIGGVQHQPQPAVFGTTEVTVSPDNRLHDAVGQNISVHCYHHQSLNEVAADLRVVARAGDGTVEAVVDPEQPFLLGVQWHPEEDPTDARLFTALRIAAIESVNAREHQRNLV
ncbi:gamma-glutamyl-gamma-aminobutyrate hydrolase family protein [Rhodococcus koreensis]